MLTVCLCLLGADNRPWTTYMPTWYDLYFWDQFPVLSLQCLSWEKLIFSPKSSVWKPKHCFLYHPLYSPAYLLFPIHTDYCRLRVSLHSWHRLWLLVSLQWSPQIFLSFTFSTTWWAKVKAEIPAVLLGEAPRDPSPFRGSSFTATELQAVCSPWSKVWRPQKVVGQKDRGGKSLGRTTSFPLSWKSHVCQAFWHPFHHHPIRKQSLGVSGKVWCDISCHHTPIGPNISLNCFDKVQNFPK